MAILAQASLHFRAPRLTEWELDAIAERLFEIADRNARAMLPIDDFEIYVEVEDGSVKTRAQIVAGVLAAIYLGMGNFGDFVGSVKETARIGRALGRAINAEFVERMGPSPRDITYSRPDAGLAGQLERLFNQVEKGEITSEEATKRALRLLERAGEPLPRPLTEQIKRDIGLIRVLPDASALPPPRAKVVTAPTMRSIPSIPALQAERDPDEQTDLLKNNEEHPMAQRRRKIKIWKRPGESKQKSVS